MLAMACFPYLIGSECVEIDNFYVALQPAGSMTATEGDNLHFVCSTNLPANYARWEINDVKFPDNLPPGFSASGFTIEFSIEETVQIRCFIRVSISGSLADVCSNTATVALEGVPLQSHGLLLLCVNKHGCILFYFFHS